MSDQDENRERALDELTDLVPEIIKLSEDDIKIIMESINNPSDPTQELVTAFKNYIKNKDV